MEVSGFGELLAEFRIGSRKGWQLQAGDHQPRQHLAVQDFYQTCGTTSGRAKSRRGRKASARADAPREPRGKKLPARYIPRERSAGNAEDLSRTISSRAAPSIAGHSHVRNNNVECKYYQHRQPHWPSGAKAISHSPRWGRNMRCRPSRIFTSSSTKKNSGLVLGHYLSRFAAPHGRASRRVKRGSFAKLRFKSQRAAVLFHHDGPGKG